MSKQSTDPEPSLASIPETAWEKIRHSLGKIVAPCFPHRSRLGRIIRTRLCKRPPTETMIATEIVRARHQILEFDPDTEVLVLGSSHTQYSIFPSPNDALRLWNSGLVDGDLFQAWHIYAALRDRWPKHPGQIVLLCEDFWAPANQAEYTSDYWISAVFHCIAGLPMRTTFALGHICRRIRLLEHNCPPEATFRGHLPLKNQVYAGPPTSLQKRVADHIRRATEFAPSELVWQERLRAAVEADGRKLILFRPPLRADYRAELARQAAGRDVYAPGAKVREGLPILDYTETPIPEDGWYDTDHINDTGAAWFTPRLIADLQALRAAQ